MTLIQYLHHAEQMEAARREFWHRWMPHRRDLLKVGVSYWNLSCIEQHAWTDFLIEKNLEPKTK